MLSRASLIAWCAPLWLIGACGESRSTDEEPARGGAGAPSAGRSGSGGRLNGGAGQATAPGGEGGSTAGAGGDAGADAGASADAGAGQGGEAGMRADGGADSGGRGGEAGRDSEPGESGAAGAAGAGGAAETLTTAVEPRELAISSRGLFWIEEPTYDEPIVSMLDWSDIEAAPRVIASAPGAWALAARGDEVYWITGAALSASIYRIRIGEAEPELLVEGERMLGSLTVDDHYLYWASGDPEHRLNRMCR